MSSTFRSIVVILMLSAGQVGLAAQDDQRTLSDRALESAAAPQPPTSEARPPLDLTLRNDLPASPWRNLFSVRSSEPERAVMSSPTSGSGPRALAYTSGLEIASPSGRTPQMPAWMVSGGAAVRLTRRMTVMAGVRFHHGYTPQMIFQESAGIDLARVNPSALQFGPADPSVAVTTRLAVGYNLLDTSRLDLTAGLELQNFVPALASPATGTPKDAQTRPKVLGTMSVGIK